MITSIRPPASSTFLGLPKEIWLLIYTKILEDWQFPGKNRLPLASRYFSWLKRDPILSRYLMRQYIPMMTDSPEFNGEPGHDPADYSNFLMDTLGARTPSADTVGFYKYIRYNMGPRPDRVMALRNYVVAQMIHGVPFDRSLATAKGFLANIYFHLGDGQRLLAALEKDAAILHEWRDFIIQELAMMKKPPAVIPPNTPIQAAVRLAMTVPNLRYLLALVSPTVLYQSGINGFIVAAEMNNKNVMIKLMARKCKLKDEALANGTVIDFIDDPVENPALVELAQDLDGNDFHETQENLGLRRCPYREVFPYKIIHEPLCEQAEKWHLTDAFAAERLDALGLELLRDLDMGFQLALLTPVCRANRVDLIPLFNLHDSRDYQLNAVITLFIERLAQAYREAKENNAAVIIPEICLTLWANLSIRRYLVKSATLLAYCMSNDIDMFMKNFQDHASLGRRNIFEYVTPEILERIDLFYKHFWSIADSNGKFDILGEAHALGCHDAVQYLLSHESEIFTHNRLRDFFGENHPLAAMVPPTILERANNLVASAASYLPGFVGNRRKADAKPDNGDEYQTKRYRKDGS